MLVLELRAYLLADSAIASLIGVRMHPVNLPQNIRYPALSYMQVSNVRERDLCGPAGFAHPRISINSWSETYIGARDLAEAVRVALEGFRGQFTPTGARVGSARLDNELDGDEPDVGIYRVLQDYIISHAED